MTNTYKRIQAIKTADVILKFVSKSPSPVTGSEIAEATEISHGTVMSQVSTMVDIAWLTEVGGGYQVGMGLAVYWARMKSQVISEFRDKFEILIKLIGG